VVHVSVADAELYEVMKGTVMIGPSYETGGSRLGGRRRALRGDERHGDAVQQCTCAVMSVNDKLLLLTLSDVIVRWT